MMNRPLDDSRLLPQGAVAAEVRSLRDGVVTSVQDWLAEEVPVALDFNGITQAVMLATPADLDDFALGFALSEGLLQSRDELRGIETLRSAEGITLRLEVSAASEWRLRERRRLLAGRTGCGLCGAESLAQVQEPRPQPLQGGVRLSPQAISRAQRELRQWQQLQQLTGCTHAAAWCSARDGSVQLVREDIGRHNALDKLLGALARGRAPELAPDQGFVCITSRASYEMVLKSARLGVSALAAVSAPTAMAVAMAQQAGQLLVGFVRGDDLVAYTHAERLVLAAPAE